MSDVVEKCACGAPWINGCTNQIHPFLGELNITTPIWGVMGEWVPYTPDAEKEALKKELEDARRELTEAKLLLSQRSTEKFKVSHEVVFTPKTES